MIFQSKDIRIFGKKTYCFCCKMKLSNGQRARAIDQIEAGATATHVACQFGVNKKTIRRLRTKFATHGTVADRPRSGRPRVMTLKNTQRRHLLLVN